MKRLALLLVLSGCGSSDIVTGDAQAITELSYGNDRIGRVLSADPRKAPRNFTEFERLFSVGRACARSDSREVYIVEETQTRETGEQVASALLPRAVITGCNTGNKSDPNTIRQSFSLMVALVSTQSLPVDDPMVLQRVEAMALDDTTGLYNFYAFDDLGEGRPALVTRTTLENGRAFEYVKEPGKSVQKVPASFNCFACHTGGGLLMNELSSPWTNWVSQRKRLPVSHFTGDTLSIVAESAPMGTSLRSSLANDLERTMKEGTRAFIESGWGPKTLAETGGLDRMLRSVFCETALNYTSGADSLPMELFFEPTATNGTDILAPTAPPNTEFPRVMPIRSEQDKRVELFLQKKGYLTPETVKAIRLLDDAHDVFSERRCAIHAELAGTLPAEPAAVELAVRTHLLRMMEDGRIPNDPPARFAYIAALLDDDVALATLTQTRTAFQAELLTRAQAAFASPDHAKLEAEDKRRKDAALVMFPLPTSPLPVFP